MATQWLYRINVIIPLDNQAAMNALWTLVAPEGDAEARTFGAPLSPSGSEPATHTGISTAATGEMRAMIVDTFAAELAGAVVSIQPYTENNWDALLSANGLKVIQKEMV